MVARAGRTAGSEAPKRYLSCLDRCWRGLRRRIAYLTKDGRSGSAGASLKIESCTRGTPRREMVAEEFGADPGPGGV
jgi:hypothetical protein